MCKQLGTVCGRASLGRDIYRQGPARLGDQILYAPEELRLRAEIRHGKFDLSQSSHGPRRFPK
jgi:hypothetical protein